MLPFMMAIPTCSRGGQCMLCQPYRCIDLFVSLTPRTCPRVCPPMLLQSIDRGSAGAFEFMTFCISVAESLFLSFECRI